MATKTEADQFPIKQEFQEEVDDGQITNEYILQQQKLPYKNEFSEKSEDEPPPKRARRAAAQVKVIMDEDSDDDYSPPVTKNEDNSEDDSDRLENDDDDSADFPDEPSTSADQPGPSGVTKAVAEAPFGRFKTMEPLITITEEPWIKKLPEIEVTKVNHRPKKQPKYKNPFVYKKYKKPNPKYVENVEDEDKYNIGSSSKNVKWACMICSEIKANKLELIQHYEFHKLETEKLKKGSGKADGGDFFVCPACLTEFTSLKGYEKHVELHHGEKQYRCNLCKKSFKTLFIQCIHNFNVHNDAEDVAEYECIPCGYTTEDQKILKQHIKELHEENVKYRCEICQNGFSSLQWYEEHKNFHTGAMPFKCDECGKSFMYTRYLVAHQKSMHQADVSVSHECETCNKKFAHKKSLVLHMRGHTGGNAVLCDICGKSLSSTEHLKQHIRIHTGFKPHCCSVCGKGFAKKCNLTLHERVHSGEKPHTCNVCGKSFSQRSTLVIHGRYHSGERPYVCQLCNKGFVAKGLLGVHMKTCPGLMGPGYSHLEYC